MESNQYKDPSALFSDLRRAADGDEDEWRRLVASHRKRLHGMVSVRLDRRMQGRVDASDVVQDALVEAWSKIGDYLADPKMPFYIWLRSIAGHKLMALHRHHLGTKMRAADREISLNNGAIPESSSAAIADFFVSNEAHPSEAAIRIEMSMKLQDCLNDMSVTDREVISLRHFEQLSNSDTASILGISILSASKRYIRAIQRLKGILLNVPEKERYAP